MDSLPFLGGFESQCLLGRSDQPEDVFFCEPTDIWNQVGTVVGKKWGGGGGLGFALPVLVGTNKNFVLRFESCS